MVLGPLFPVCSGTSVTVTAVRTISPLVCLIVGHTELETGDKMSVIILFNVSFSALFHTFTSLIYRKAVRHEVLWSSGPISHTQASLSHELWKVPQGPRNNMAPSRPPPGLTNTKPSSTWGGKHPGPGGWMEQLLLFRCVCKRCS